MVNKWLISMDENGFPHFILELCSNDKFLVKQVDTTTEENIPVETDDFAEGSIGVNGCVRIEFSNVTLWKESCWDAFSLLIFQIKSLLVEKGLIHD